LYCVGFNFPATKWISLTPFFVRYLIRSFRSYEAKKKSQLSRHILVVVIISYEVTVEMA
jgi:hypothetical protein